MSKCGLLLEQAKWLLKTTNSNLNYSIYSGRICPSNNNLKLPLALSKICPKMVKIKLSLIITFRIWVGNQIFYCFDKAGLAHQHLKHRPFLRFLPYYRRTSLRRNFDHLKLPISTNRRTADQVPNWLKQFRPTLVSQSYGT